MQWCYMHKTHKVVVGERTSFGYALGNPDTWYITDDVPPQLACKARIVLLTSPMRETYKVRMAWAAWGCVRQGVSQHATVRQAD